jgi:hypothetical protein
VAKFCIENPGKITQLNMGEGKTRVILPMLLLHLSLSHPGNVIRLHFLAPLLGEAYDFLHWAVTASLLRKKLFVLPFQRDVKLTLKDARAIEQCLCQCREGSGALCIAPEHRLSLQLKWIEGGTSPEIRKCLKGLEDFPFIDIFDESDEILHHKFQLIYAAGSCTPLPAAKERWVAAQAILNVLQQNSRVKQILQKRGIASRLSDEKSGVFDTIKLLPGKCLDESRISLLEAVADGVMSNPPYYMRWLKDHSSVDLIKEFIVDPQQNIQWFQSKTPPLTRKRLDQVLALRGFLAYGILEHCLSRRFQVDYGIDPRRGIKRRIAVPFRACDNPAERAEYADPDITILLTQLSYYYQGLTSDEVGEMVRSLLKCGPSAQQKEYALWLESARASLDEKHACELDDVKKLDPTNQNQLASIHSVYQFNMAAINFWLATCVFPRETMQFPQRLIANACHLASNKNDANMGFSGTKDNRLLLPPQVELRIPEDDTLIATDGKMVDLLLENEEVVTLGDPKHVQERIMKLAVDSGAHAIIDTGASMAGLSNADVADRLLHLLSKLSDGRSSKLRGVVFFDTKEETWTVKSLQGRTWPLGSSPIKESGAFVFFDESRCRGVDKKLASEARAVITLSLGMCKDKLMQAAGRMRKLDCGQHVIFAVPDEVARKICVDESELSSISPKQILEWVIQNTVDTTALSLSEWASQASYFATTQEPKARLLDEVIEVEDLYGETIGEGRVDDFVARMIAKNVQRVKAKFGVRPDKSSRALLERVAGHASSYGSDQIVVQSKNNEECERELENERELEREVEREIPKQRPQTSEDWGISALLTAVSPTRLPSEARILTLRKAVQSRYKASKLASINWDSQIYVTSNFLETVCSLEGKPLDDLSDFMRPIDAIVLFSSPGEEGRAASCLLLSEWEADRFLSLLGTNSSTNTSFVNLAYLREAADNEWRTPIKLQTPTKRSQNAISEEMMAGLQLFAGDTKYKTAGRKRALGCLLPTPEARRAALGLMDLRGQSKFVSRSDLEEVCELDMLDNPKPAS